MDGKPYCPQQRAFTCVLCLLSTCLSCQTAAKDTVREVCCQKETLARSDIDKEQLRRPTSEIQNLAKSFFTAPV